MSGVAGFYAGAPSALVDMPAELHHSVDRRGRADGAAGRPDGIEMHQIPGGDA